MNEHIVLQNILIIITKKNTNYKNIVKTELIIITLRNGRIGNAIEAEFD